VRVGERGGFYLRHQFPQEGRREGERSENEIWFNKGGTAEGKHQTKAVRWERLARALKFIALAGEKPPLSIRGGTKLSGLPKKGEKK